MYFILPHYVKTQYFGILTFNKAASEGVSLPFGEHDWH